MFLFQMGINDIFNPAANFTGIVSNEYLRVGNIIQTAKIEINEEGTIAAAVTGNYHRNMISFNKLQIMLILIKLQNFRLYHSWVI